MFKQTCLLIIVSLLCACVATKPVATETMFLSEWEPELMINIPAKFSQFGPYIIDGKERKKGFVREDYYPYLEINEDGSVLRSLFISLIARGHRKVWVTNTEYELDLTTVAGGTSIIQDTGYITAISKGLSISPTFEKKLMADNVVLSSPYIVKSYVTKKSWIQPRVVIEYAERIDNDLLNMILQWKRARLEQRIPVKNGFSRIPGTAEYPPSEDIKLYLEQFEQRADSLVSAQQSKRVLGQLIHKSLDTKKN